MIIFEEWVKKYYPNEPKRVLNKMPDSWSTGELEMLILNNKKRKAAQNQQNPIKPTGNQIVVVDEVIKDLEARAEVGIERYGQKLRTFNGRDSMMDAYQEVLDLAMYFKQMILERKSNE